MRLIPYLILCSTLGLGVLSCKGDEEVLDSQKSSFKSYLSGKSYVEQNGVYRYVLNSDREGYLAAPLLEYGDSAILRFAAYTFGSPLGSLFYSNTKRWLPTGFSDLNPTYWRFEPWRVKMGSTTMFRGLEYGLVNSKQKDSMQLFITSDLAYGKQDWGILSPNTPTVWVFAVDSVMKAAK